MFTYYMGSDGAWYNKQVENANQNAEQYKYTDGTRVQMFNANSYKWFKVESIKWRVLNASNSRAQSTPKFLLAENGIASLAYYDGSEERTVNVNGANTTIYANNYKHSMIRAWLNGIYYESGALSRPHLLNRRYQNIGFYQTAFTTSQQNAINDTIVDNSAASTNPNGASQTWNSGTNTYACANTTDKVFLLSESEVTTSSYGFGAYNAADTARVRKPTDFALALGAEKSSGGGSKWWLRSPYCNYTTLARRVVTDGNTDPRIMQTMGGVDDSYKVSFNAVVVVPALYYQP